MGRLGGLLILMGRLAGSLILHPSVLRLYGRGDHRGIRFCILDLVGRFLHCLHTDQLRIQVLEIAKRGYLVQDLRLVLGIGHPIDRLAGHHIILVACVVVAVLGSAFDLEFTQIGLCLNSGHILTDGLSLTLGYPAERLTMDLLVYAHHSHILDEGE